MVFFIPINLTCYGEIWEVHVSLQDFNASFDHRHFIIHHKHELNTWTISTVKYFSISIRIFIVHKNSSMRHIGLSRYWNNTSFFKIYSLLRGSKGVGGEVLAYKQPPSTQRGLSVILDITLLLWDGLERCSNECRETKTQLIILNPSQRTQTIQWTNQNSK